MIINCNDICMYRTSKCDFEVGRVLETRDECDMILVGSYDGAGDSVWVKNRRVVGRVEEPTSSTDLNLLNANFIQNSLEKLCKLHNATPENSWAVGDFCVCRWQEDGNYYVARISRISDLEGKCDVEFLYYYNAQYDWPLGDLEEADDIGLELVEDELNLEDYRVVSERVPRAVMKSPTEKGKDGTNERSDSGVQVSGSSGKDDSLSAGGPASVNGKPSETVLEEKVESLGSKSFAIKPAVGAQESPLGEWGVGDFCVCQSEEDKLYYVGRVIRVCEFSKTCDVEFLFYNNIQYNVPLGEMKDTSAASLKLVNDKKSIEAFNEVQVSKQLAGRPPLESWQVGDICIFEQQDSHQGLFAEIVAITQGACKVQILHTQERQTVRSPSNLNKLDPNTMTHVYDPFNIDALKKLNDPNLNEMLVVDPSRRSLSYYSSKVSVSSGDVCIYKKGRGELGIGIFDQYDVLKYQVRITPALPKNSTPMWLSPRRVVKFMPPTYSDRDKTQLAPTFIRSTLKKLKTFRPEDAGFKFFPCPTWKVGDLCVSQWDGGRTYYVGRVASISETRGTCSVEFLNYGNLSVGVRLEDLECLDSVGLALVMEPDNLKALNLGGEEEEASPWSVGDVCLWPNETPRDLYVARITAVDAAAHTCDLSILHYKTPYEDVPFDRLQAVTPESLRFCSDTDNRRAYDKFMKKKQKKERKEAESAAGNVDGNTSNVKPPQWFDEGLKSLSASGDAVRDMLVETYLAGYKAGQSLALLNATKK